jgi:hypothetical protein
MQERLHSMSDFITILLTQKQTATIDAKNADLNQYKWYAHKRENTHYAVRKTGGRKNSVAIYMHREILGRKIGRPLSSLEHCDHIDGNGLNNTEDNLRLVTPSQNIMNSRIPKNNTSGVKGVSWMKTLQKWRAYIFIDGTQKHLGLFSDIEEAVKVRKDAENELFGEYAKPT